MSLIINLTDFLGLKLLDPSVLYLGGGPSGSMMVGGAGMEGTPWYTTQVDRACLLPPFSVLLLVKTNGGP